MGGGHSVPERLDEDLVRQIAGAYYDSNDFEEMSKNTPGYITKDQLMMAAQKRGLSMNLRRNHDKNFSFDAFDGEAKGESKVGDAKCDDDDDKEAK